MFADRKLNVTTQKLQHKKSIKMWKISLYFNFSIFLACRSARASLSIVRAIGRASQTDFIDSPAAAIGYCGEMRHSIQHGEDTMAMCMCMPARPARAVLETPTR